MGISIQEYRSRIGSFLPNMSKSVKRKTYQKYVQKLPFWVSLLVISVVVFNFTCLCPPEIQNEKSQFYHSKACCIISSPISVNQVSCYFEMSNFYARYRYGNKQTKGIKIAHFNKGCGFLASKKQEIENLISEFQPHMLGISEANFFKDHSYDDVQFVDYNFHLCKTLANPELEYSRIVVYTHKSLICKIRPDLMNDDISSIWMQVGLPNQKKILVCQVYREWQFLQQADGSSNSIQAQLQRWVIFLD